MGCSTSVPLDESTSKRTQFEEYTAEVDTEDDNNDNSDINIIRCSINKTRASMFDNPERARRFCEHYAFPEDGKQILAVLGAAFVYKGYDTRDRTPVAVFETSIDDAVTLEELRTDFEAQMAVRVDHPNILRCLGIGDDGNTFFAIMEYTNGGDLFQWLGSRDTFDECDARLIFYQVASAVEYLHSKDMLHGNVRPESLLLVADDNGINVSGQIRPKLGGFFLSEQLSLSKPNLPAPFVTELKYNSPEQIRSKGNYGLPSDIWSLGVILHVLLVGDVPFKAGMNDDDDVALKKAIKNEPLTMDEADGWADISESAKDLVAGMLEKVPAKRLTALQVLQHDWCLNLKKKLDGDGETEVLPDHISRLRAFNRSRTLQRTLRKVNCAVRLQQHRRNSMKNDPHRRPSQSPRSNGKIITRNEMAQLATGFSFNESYEGTEASSTDAAATAEINDSETGSNAASLKIDVVDKVPFASEPCAENIASTESMAMVSTTDNASASVPSSGNEASELPPPPPEKDITETAGAPSTNDETPAESTSASTSTSTDVVNPPSNDDAEEEAGEAVEPDESSVEHAPTDEGEIAPPNPAAGQGKKKKKKNKNKKSNAEKEKEEARIRTEEEKRTAAQKRGSIVIS